MVSAQKHDYHWITGYGGGEISEGQSWFGLSVLLCALVMASAWWRGKLLSASRLDAVLVYPHRLLWIRLFMVLTVASYFAGFDRGQWRERGRPPEKVLDMLIWYKRSVTGIPVMGIAA